MDNLELERKQASAPVTAILSGRRRVLVADDDPAFRLLLATALERAGYDVVRARDGADLLRAMADGAIRGQRPFDAIVTDLRMPRLDGMQVLAGLRRNGVDTFVVLMSAFIDDELRRAAVQHGADAILSKPFDVEELAILLYEAAASEATGDGDAAL